MTSPFRNHGDPLVCSFARKEGDQDRVHWRVRARGGQDLLAEEFRDSDSFRSQGLRIVVAASDPDAPFSYVRAEFELSGLSRGKTLQIDLAYALQDAPGVFFILELHRSDTFSDLIHSQTVVPPDSTTVGTASITIASDLDAWGEGPVYGYIQACLKTDAGAIVEISSLTICELAENSDFRPLKIRYEMFGDRNSASSRLRGWKFADILKGEGHEVTVGGPPSFADILFCQKVRPFKIVEAIRNENPKVVVVYDFDDNYLLPSQGVQADVISFMNIADVVTCGSENIAALAREYHPNVHVLENPLDVEHSTLVRPPRGDLKRVGWFGAPENLAELLKIDGAEAVTTLTRGGDVEYSQLTIDSDLIEFDLLLFPVEPSAWNLAKNANRMIKALGLGIPVLASDTPEQTRIHGLVELPDACLLSGFGGWQARVGQIAADFTEIELATLRAREILRETYNPRAVLGKLFSHISRTTVLGRGLRRTAIKASKALDQFGALVVDGTITGAASAGIAASRIDWSCFGRIGFFSAGGPENPIYSLPSERRTLAFGDYLNAYAGADSFIERLDKPNLIVMPAGIALGSGMVPALTAFAEQTQADVAIFAYSGHSSANLHNTLAALPLADLMRRPMATGPIAVKTAWLRENPVQWREALDLWRWRVLVMALARKVAIEAHELPLCFQVIDQPVPNPARNFANWCAANDPRIARDLPDADKQWDRMLIDIVTPAAAQAGESLPIAFGQLVSEFSTLRRRLYEAESALKATRMSN